MKVKMLIVDDEPMQLSLIRSVVQKLRPSYEITATYVPQQALELLKQQPINALITDVKMPDISGIELIEAARAFQISPLEIIILSGFDDFQYAKKAISNGVLEYLLKPVSGDSIRAALDKLDQKLEQDYLRQTMDVQYSRLRYAQQANSLLKYVNGAALTMREQYIIDTAAEQGDLRLTYIWKWDAQKTEDTFFSVLPPSCIAEMPDNQYLFFGIGQGTTLEWIHAWLNRLPGCCAVIGSRTCLRELPQRWERLRRLTETARHFRVTRIEEQPQNLELVRQFGQALEQQRHEQIPQLCKSLTFAMMNGAVAVEDIRQMGVELLEGDAHADDALAAALTAERVQALRASHTPEEVAALFNQWKSPIENTEANDFAHRVQRYIDAHCSDACSLGDIAEAFHYSTSHFSRLFTEYFQSSYTKFLADFRLKKACALLAQTNLTVREVAAQVGIKDEGYFIRQFKSRFGMSPAKYRRSLGATRL